MQAFYYLPNYEANECLNTYSNQFLFSEIDETQLWCSPNRYSTLLGLDFSIFNHKLSMVLLAVTSFLLFVL